MAREWHILAAWPFGVGLLFIWIAMLANGHFRRDLVTKPSDWTPAGVIASLKAHAGGGGDSHGYNPMQRILYGMVFGVLLPLMLFTGLAISPGFQAAAPWLLEVLGGRQSARSLHFIAAWGLFGFVAIHLVLALTSWRLILEMVTGGKREIAPPPEPEPAVEGEPAHG
jgi:thiosulfate reductase cytochrome b subunit